MALVDSLQKALEYMEDKMLEDITIEDISQHAHLSPFHFQRTFTILTDISVAEYLRRRRLTLAAKEVCSSDIKVIDLAFKYGYDTPESFSKSFKRQHHVNPSEMRKGLGKIQSYHRLTIQVSLKGEKPMKYKVIEKEAFQVVGIKREYSLIDNENLIEIPKFWQEVHQDGTHNSLIQLNKGTIQGVMGVCVDGSDKYSNRIEYWIATEVEVDTSYTNLLSLSIPASKWAVFEVHGPMPNAMQEGWKQIYSEWLPSNKFEIADLPELEVYPNEDPNNEGLYSEIWIPIK